MLLRNNCGNFLFEKNVRKEIIKKWGGKYEKRGEYDGKIIKIF